MKTTTHTQFQEQEGKNSQNRIERLAWHCIMCGSERWLSFQRARIGEASGALNR